MIEAQCEGGFGLRVEGLTVLVPVRLLGAGTHSHDEVLFRERNRGRPGETKGAEVGDGGDGFTRGLNGKAPGLSIADEGLVARG